MIFGFINSLRGGVQIPSSFITPQIQESCLFRRALNKVCSCSKETRQMWGRGPKQELRQGLEKRAVRTDLRRDDALLSYGGKQYTTKTMLQGQCFLQKTRVFGDYMKGLKSRLKLYANVHSFGQMILVPWAYTEEEYKHNEYVMDVVMPVRCAANWPLGKNI